MKILLLDLGQPFGLTSLYNEPLGGSESSLLLLSQGLSELGHSSIILNRATVDLPQHSHNRVLHSVSILPQVLPDTECIITNRSFVPDILHSNIPLVYYAHDAYDQIHMVGWMLDKKFVDRVNLVLCVSEWQRQTFHKYFNMPLDKMVVVGNSIDDGMYYGYTERDPNKLIFASIPFKGLEVLPDLFRDICVSTRNDELSLAVYSSMELYAQEEKNQEYMEPFSKLAKMKNVTLNRPVSMKELSYQLMTSSLYIHPNTYHETFGMNLVQAQAAGCIPITTDNGAVNEVIKNGETGVITKGKTILDSDCYYEFVEKASSLLEADKYKMSLNAQKFAKQWSYLNVAQAVTGHLEGLNVNSHRKEEQGSRA